MSTIVLFSIATAMVAFGTSPMPGAVAYHWMIEYESGAVQDFTTTEARVDFEPLEGRVFTVKVQFREATTGWSAFSEPSYEVVSDPLEGDVDFNGVVNFKDFNLVQRRFGDALP